MKKHLLFVSFITTMPLFSMDQSDKQSERKAREEMALLAAAHGKTDWLMTLSGDVGYKNLAFESVSEQGATPFYIACQEGHYRTVAQLVALKNVASKPVLLKSQNGETFECTPLHIAAAKGHVAVLNALLKNENKHCSMAFDSGAGIDGSDRYRLVSTKIDINTQKAPKQRTPLHLATAHGHLEAIAVLLEFNADIFKKDDDGHTPLNIATQHPNPDVLQQFKEATSPLLKTIEAGNEEALKNLIALKFDLEEKGPHGNTPLLEAIFYNNLNMVKTLLDAGANIECKDEYGRSAFDYAQDLLKGEEQRQTRNLKKPGFKTNGPEIMQLLITVKNERDKKAAANEKGKEEETVRRFEPAKNDFWWIAD